jgi:hypothetical protein
MWYFSASHFILSISPVDAKLAEVDLKEDFEDTKGAIRFVYRKRTDNTMSNRKSTKGQTTTNKIYI